MVAWRRPGVVLFAVVLACATLTPAMAAQKASAKPPPKARPATPLPWRAEGRPSYTLDAVAYPDSSGWQLAVSVRIPPDAVKFVADEDTAHAAQARLRRIVDVMLADHRTAWDLRSDGAYIQRMPDPSMPADSPHAAGTFATMMREAVGGL